MSATPTRRPAAGHTPWNIPHAPTPWRFNEQANTLKAAGDQFVADMNRTPIGAREAILRAVNNHASLLAALEAARVVVEADGARATLAIIDAALERARG